jgi:SAM-dependent methyltransferase
VLLALDPGRRLVGVDISERMLARAAHRLRGTLVRASAVRLPFVDARFDGVVGVHVLHLLPDLATALAEVARVLRPGGRMVAVHAGPHHADDDGLVTIMRPLGALRPPRRDSASAVLAAAREVGLDVISQHEDSPLTSRQSPAEIALLVERWTWSYVLERGRNHP